MKWDWKSDLVGFGVVWLGGVLMGIGLMLSNGTTDTQRHDEQVSKCLNVAQKWCPTDAHRQHRFEWCMKQWKQK
tara:strand:+ start:2511 stop:2732 length:222 start_codon:yes stop_codon:yes gene_type:complete